MPVKPSNPKASEQLRQEFGLEGSRLNLLLDDVIVPVVLVADVSCPQTGVAQKPLFHAAAYVTGGALQYCMSGLFNPAGSGIITEVQSVLCSSLFDTDWNHHISLRPHNTALGGANVDYRQLNPLYPISADPGTQHRTSQTEGAITSSGVFGHNVCSHGIQVTWDVAGMELREGEGVYVWSEELGQHLTVNWKWAERRVAGP